MIITIYISAVFTVNSAADTSDANLGDGICATSTGECTLRAAVEEANSLDGVDTIYFAVPSVSLNDLLYIDDSLYILGRSTVDSIFCTSFTGDCLHSKDYLYLRRLYIRSLKTSVASYSHLEAVSVSVDADTFGIYSSLGKLEVRNSNILSDEWGIVSFHDTFVVIRNTTFDTGGEGFQYYTDSELAPDSIINNTFYSDNVCMTVQTNGKNILIRNNELHCVRGGLQFFDEPTNAVIPESLFVDSNDVYIYGYRAEAIRVERCVGCGVGRNRLLGTDTAGVFIYLVGVKNSTIWNNTNLDGTTYTNAGSYAFIILENSDSNTIRNNRWDFSTIKDSTSGIQLMAGSDFNTIDSNYVANLAWGGLVIYDSSSYNEFYMDSVVNTAGIQLRRHWRGRYAFPFTIDTTYNGLVGKGNLFKKVYSSGHYNAMIVVGMDSTVIDSSEMVTLDLWGNAISNAGSELYVYNSLIRGISTAADTGGYGISLEYFYGENATAAGYADDSLFTITVENTEFRDLGFAFRVMDIDTSYIKLDTLFDDNNNTLTGYTYSYYGDYYLPVIVQSLDLSCNPSVVAIDSVKLEDIWGFYVLLDKINTEDALWSFHWEPVSTVYYDSLHMWYPAKVLYYDDVGNIGTPNPYVVRFYGENGTDLTFAPIRIERGLVNYTDPCPVAGPVINQTVYPKTVDNRWLVLKFRYDPAVLPVDIGEDAGRYVLRVGVMQIPVAEGEEVGIYSTSGRLIRKVRVSGDRKIDLAPGVYFIKTREKTYRVPVF
ncbi:MAG: CSLREA domain-containing protein [Crenarchaeota archaeon]|nr:CSLREA domain-containing protein [Thermoproteota archaeon]